MSFPHTPTWPARIDLPEGVRQPVIALLNQQLADAIDLGLQARQAHWNVKGPQFVPLHALSDETAQSLSELTDELAERAVQLGGVAQGTLHAVNTATRLPAYDVAASTGADHLNALGAAMARFAETTRAAIDTAAATGDATTADVFTGVSRAADKLLWKIFAHGTAVG